MKQKVTVLAIAAYNKLGYMGKDNDLLYKIGDDLARFKKITAGSVMVMGRKTFESLPGLLPGRHHVVITGNPKAVEAWSTYNKERVTVCCDFNTALEHAKWVAGNLNLTRVSVIGGHQVFKDALPHIDEAHLTLIYDDKKGDVMFPAAEYTDDLSSAEEWESIDEYEPIKEKDFEIQFISMRRKRPHRSAITEIRLSGNRELLHLPEGIRIFAGRLIGWSPVRLAPVIEFATLDDERWTIRFRGDAERDAALKRLDELFDVPI